MALSSLSLSLLAVSLFLSTVKGQSGHSFFYFYRRNGPSVSNSRIFAEEPEPTAPSLLSYPAIQPTSFYESVSGPVPALNNAFVVPTQGPPLRTRAFHRFSVPNFQRTVPIVQPRPSYFGSSQIHQREIHHPYVAPIQRSVPLSHTLRRFYHPKKNTATGYAFTIGSAEESSHSTIHFTLGSTSPLVETNQQGRPESIVQVPLNLPTSSSTTTTKDDLLSPPQSIIPSENERNISSHDESSHGNNQLITGIGDNANDVPDHLVEPEANRETRVVDVNNQISKNELPTPLPNLDQNSIDDQMKLKDNKSTMVSQEFPSDGELSVNVLTDMGPMSPTIMTTVNKTFLSEKNRFATAITIMAIAKKSNNSLGAENNETGSSTVATPTIMPSALMNSSVTTEVNDANATTENTNLSTKSNEVNVNTEKENITSEAISTSTEVTSTTTETKSTENQNESFSTTTPATDVTTANVTETMLNETGSSTTVPTTTSTEALILAVTEDLTTTEAVTEIMDEETSATTEFSTLQNEITPVSTVSTESPESISTSNTTITESLPTSTTTELITTTVEMETTTEKVTSSTSTVQMIMNVETLAEVDENEDENEITTTTENIKFTVSEENSSSESEEFNDRSGFREAFVQDSVSETTENESTTDSSIVDEEMQPTTENFVETTTTTTVRAVAEVTSLPSTKPTTNVVTDASTSTESIVTSSAPKFNPTPPTFAITPTTLNSTVKSQLVSDDEISNAIAQNSQINPVFQQLSENEKMLMAQRRSLIRALKNLRMRYNASTSTTTTTDRPMAKFVRKFSAAFKNNNVKRVRVPGRRRKINKTEEKIIVDNNDFAGRQAALNESIIEFMNRMAAFTNSLEEGIENEDMNETGKEDSKDPETLVFSPENDLNDNEESLDNDSREEKILLKMLPMSAPGELKVIEVTNANKKDMSDVDETSDMLETMSSTTEVSEMQEPTNIMEDKMPEDQIIAIMETEPSLGLLETSMETSDSDSDEVPITEVNTEMTITEDNSKNQNTDADTFANLTTVSVETSTKVNDEIEPQTSLIISEVKIEQEDQNFNDTRLENSTTKATNVTSDSTFSTTETMSTAENSEVESLSTEESTTTNMVSDVDATIPNKTTNLFESETTDGAGTTELPEEVTTIAFLNDLSASAQTPEFRPSNVEIEVPDPVSKSELVPGLPRRVRKVVKLVKVNKMTGQRKKLAKTVIKVRRT